ncbi:MAG: DUF5694 domain-containing protein [Bacteroidales bacterium]|nr:DUF5694 domain-containing protein [Bacteroidales bacterium]MCF8337940.1 DUF5694 domain-containing protein [Bacteroidales bacterium]
MRNTILKITSTIIILTFLMIIMGSSAQTNPDKDAAGVPKPKISILGTFHFGTTGDVAAVKVEDIMGKRRQKEIRQMLTQIKEYKPTKVLVEVVRHKNKEYNQKYRNYLKGEFDLEKNEIYQLGFRMAGMMNHESIYAIDYTLKQPFGEVQEFAEKHGMGERFKSFVKSVRERAKKKSEYIANHTLMDYYRQLNTDTSDRWNRSLYLQETLDYNHDTIYTGPKIAAMHYKRNIYITANVMRHAQPGERLLLIIGSGHRSVMKHFFKTRKDIDYVEVNQFLE